jgi:hypothetical protein
MDLCLVSGLCLKVYVIITRHSTTDVAPLMSVSSSVLVINVSIAFQQ